MDAQEYKTLQEAVREAIKIYLSRQRGGMAVISIKKLRRLKELRHTKTWVYDVAVMIRKTKIIEDLHGRTWVLVDETTGGYNQKQWVYVRHDVLPAWYEVMALVK